MCSRPRWNQRVTRWEFWHRPLLVSGANAYTMASSVATVLERKIHDDRPLSKAQLHRSD
jgi:hypothetical protein